MQIQDLRKRLPLIIAVICGIFAIVLLNLYLNRREQAMLEQMRQSQEQAKVREEQARQAKLEAEQQAAQAVDKRGVVLIAQKDIPAQTPITPADLIVQELPQQEIKADAVSALDQAIGQIAGVAITKGEQVLKAKLLSPSQALKSLSEVTPEGKRAVTVPADANSNVALIRPGDCVDVFALVSAPKAASANKIAERLFTICQNVKVLAVGDEVIGSALVKERNVGSRGLVTLAVTPQEAILLSFIQEHGKIRLILRSPEDTKIEAIRPADWDALLQFISGSGDSEVQSGKDTAAVVEIYRGLDKEVVPLREKK